MRVIGPQPGEKQPLRGIGTITFGIVIRATVRPPHPQRKDAILRSLPGHLASAWRHKIFVGYVALMVLVFLVPVPTTPLAESNHVDKLVHFGVLLGFALLFYIDRAPRVGRTLLTSFAFAAAIELVQWGLPYRTGDWWDFVAGAAGASVGAVLMLLIDNRRAGGLRGRREAA